MALTLMLIVGLWISGCSDEDDSSTGPSEDEAARLASALSVTIQRGIVAAQAGEGTVQGSSGELRVEGMSWRFNRYSPEGEVFIDGELTVDAAVLPMIVRGELSLSGSLSGSLILDLSYNLTNGVFSGAISVDGVRVPMADRLCCVN